MAPATTYTLTFRSPLHIGDRGVGLEATRTHVSADTLFSALCSAWRTIYGIEGLYRDVLDWFLEEGGNEPFFLSSAFPWAGCVRFFPRPLLRPEHLTLAPGHEKSLKHVRFVSERIFADLVCAVPLRFDLQACFNDGSVWATHEEKAQLQRTWADDATGDIVLWRTAVVPRVTLDRSTAASEIWHLGETCFVHGAGLWFAAVFNPDHGDELRHRFAACLRLLGDSGLGGERGAGHGLFTPSGATDLILPEATGASHFRGFPRGEKNQPCSASHPEITRPQLAIDPVPG
jgi:CRISPR-associated protein Csm4